MRRIPLQCPRHLLRCSDTTLRALSPYRRPWTSPAQQSQLRFSSDDRQPPKRALYELLFPEENAQKTENAERERQLQELSARARAAATKTSSNEIDDSPRRRTKKRIAAAKNVLILRGASKNLLREDFLRIIPQGKNLEGWVSDRTFVEKIVQDRSLDTLERKGTYYLVFKTAAATAEYQKRAIRISKLLNFHGPPSMISERATPAALAMPGEDERALLRSYTLSPVGSALRLYQPANGLSPEMAEIAECGGLPQIVNRPGKMPAEVAVRLSMSPLSHKDLVEAIAKAEVERNLPWTGTDFEKFRCEVWRPSSRVRQGPMRQEEETAAENDSLAGSVSTGREEKHSVFIVGLQTQAEAEAFVRHWHRCTITVRKQHPSQPPVVIDADVL